MISVASLEVRHAFRLFLKVCALASLLISSSSLANGELSGSWYDPDRNGEGFHIEVWDEGQALIIWFTYPGDSDPVEAEQAWILGLGTYSDNTITIEDALKFGGPVFGPEYDKGDLEDRIWGDLTFTFQDNNTGNVVYDGADGSGEITLTHLSSLPDDAGASVLPVGFSGSWYDPDTNGQGWFIEVLSDETAIAYWFTYDENGNQAWNLGVGYIDGNKIVMPAAVRGIGTSFGDGFVKDDVEFPPYVEQVLEFHDCQSGIARYRTEEERTSGTLPMVRLTGIHGKPCHVLTIEAGEGGYVISDRDGQDCIEARTCLRNLNTQSEAGETLTAVSRVGYEFKGWGEASGEICNDEEMTCAPDFNGVESDVVLAPVFEPEGSVYYPPDDSLMVCSYIEPNYSQAVHCEMKRFEDYGYGKLSDYKVNSSQLFVDYKARKKELQLLDEPIRQEMCDMTWVSDVINFEDYVPVPPPDPDQDVNPPFPGVVGPLALGRVQFKLLDNEAAGKMVHRILLEWANNEVDLHWDLTQYHDLNGEAHYQLGLTMIMYVLAWDAIRSESFVSTEDRKKVDEYLHGLMMFLSQLLAREDGFVYEDEFDCPSSCGYATEVYNHAWTQDLSLMAYGVLTGNDTLYHRGIRRFFTVLDGIIRPDGSHYSDSQRGGSALSYSIGSTDTLIRIAELAANQGHDLYSVEIDGVSLHTIMEYHLSVLEDETLMHQYSKSVLENPFYCEDQVCADNWDNLFLDEENYHGFYRDGGWIEFDVYRRRFPDSPLIERYLAEFPGLEVFASAEGPFLHSCEFRDFTGVQF